MTKKKFAFSIEVAVTLIWVASFYLTFGIARALDGYYWLGGTCGAIGTAVYAVLLWGWPFSRPLPEPGAEPKLLSGPPHDSHPQS